MEDSFLTRYRMTIETGCYNILYKGDIVTSGFLLGLFKVGNSIFGVVIEYEYEYENNRHINADRWSGKYMASKKCNSKAKTGR